MVPRQTLPSDGKRWDGGGVRIVMRPRLANGDFLAWQRHSADGRYRNGEVSQQFGDDGIG